MQIEADSKFNSFVTKSGNILWAGALGLAWNDLKEKIVKQPIKILSKDEVALKIVRNFNTSNFTTKDISQRCIYIKSGYGQQTIKTINKECKKKFPEKSFKDLNMNLSPMDIISYAYLFKKFEFYVKFSIYKDKIFLFQNKEVPSFYAKNKKQKQQIKWYSYKDKDNFLINIDSKSPIDKIYFIKNNNIKTIDQAIQNVLNAQNKIGSILNDVDSFIMPFVELDASRNIKQLEGNVLNNKNVPNYVFSIVHEAIKLKIDQTGAKIENEGLIAVLKCALKKNQVEPKHFILDKQFWVVMKEKGKHPYFCALIKNPEDK